MKSFFIALFIPMALLAVEQNQFWDGNQIGVWWNNSGHISTHMQTGNAGLEWPLGSGDHAVFTAGLWLVAGQVNGVQEYRCAAAEFSTEFVSGPYGSDHTLPEYRIYTIEPELGQSNPDWDVWPVDQGAPWVDVDQDGVYDPAVDHPDTKGDYFSWTIFNDGDPEKHSWLWATQPLGVEVAVSAYGFDGPEPLSNTLFFEWVIRNKGDDQLDSVFAAIWQDIDLGDATNDYPGCMPDLDLSYHYVGELPDRDYGYFPPSVGYSLLQGPMVPSPGDSAYAFGTWFQDHRNLGMTAFYPYYSSAEYSDPETAYEAFMNLNGRNQDNQFHINPVTGFPDSMLFTGNPFTGEGWLASNETHPRDWRGILSSGSFSLAPGDSIQMAAACVISPGSNHLSAVAALWDDVATVRDIYQQQFTTLEDLVVITEGDVPHNTESSGPFTFQFEIHDPQGLWTNAELELEVGSSSHTTALTSLGGSLWEASIPDLGVDVTSLMEYRLHAQHGEEDLYWPPGGPYNNRLLTFGPDNDPPVLSGLERHTDVHYLLPIEKSVTIDTVYDARFPVEDVWLDWTIGGSDIMTVPMTVIDSNEVDWIPNAVYRGVLSDMGSQLGDTVRYWVRGRDGSLAQNPSTSMVESFVLSDRELIGDLDHLINLPEMADWVPFQHGTLSQYSDGVTNWLNVVLLALAADGALMDTMEMTRTLDLTPFDEVWVNIPMVASFRNELNHGLVQVRVGETYHTLDSLYGSIDPGIYTYDLSPWAGETDIGLRFLVNRGFGSLRWIIDDITLHSNPSLVGIHEPLSQPQRFVLNQNFPNPFNPQTRISYVLPAVRDVSFRIYDLKGREVMAWQTEDQSAGGHEMIWNGLDREGKQVPAGIYFGKLQAGEYHQSIKMLLIR